MNISEAFNILYVCLSESWGGLEKIAVADAADLHKRGIQTYFLCLKGSPVHRFLIENTKISVIELERAPRDHFDWNLRGLVHRLILQYDLHLIHLHQPSFLGSFAPWLINERKVSLVATRHIMNNHNKKNLYHAFLYNRLDALVVMSEALKQNVLATHPIRERRVKVIHYGVDLPKFDAVLRESPVQTRQAWGADNETLVVGLVGRIDPAKGQATLIRAAAGLKRLKALSSTPLRFVLVGEETRGSDSTYLEELKKMVTEFHLQDQVLFCGYSDKIPEVMRACDIVVMPSRQEAFGLVAIEAMAMERPVIISRGGSAEEIVGSQQEYGLLIRPEDAFDLQRQLETLISNPDLRKEMGKKGREMVVQNYRRDLRMDKTLNLYDLCLKTRRHFAFDKVR